MASDDKFFLQAFFIQLTLPRQKNKILQIVCCLLLHLPLLPLFAQEEFIDVLSIKSFQDSPLDSSFAWIENYQYQDSKTYNLKAHEVCLQAISRSYLTNDDATIAKAHRLLRDWHDATKVFTFDSIIYHDLKAIEYYTKINDLEAVAQLNNTLAMDYLGRSEFKKGEEALFRALAIFETLGDEAGIARAYQSLSLFSLYMQEPERSIQYADQAMALFKKADDYIAMAMTYLRYIKSYTLLEQYDKAYQAATACIELCETKVPADALERGFSGRDIAGRAYSFRGNLSIATQHYELALEDYTKTWKMSVEDYGEDISAGWRGEMGIACRYLGRYEEALEHLLAATQLIESLDQQSANIIDYYQEIAICYKALGNHKEALAYQEKAMALKDKVYAEKVATLEKETFAKYETGKKDQLLASQEADLAQKAYTQKLTIVGTSVMAMLLLTLFYFFRKNQQTNTELSIKNQENELLLKEVHHRVKNNLEMVSSLLKLQSVKTNNDAAKDVMLASQSRVQSMGIIHQKLYQGKNLAAIEMLDYFKNLGENSLDAFGLNEEVEIIYNMNPVELDIDTAVPIGLIVNELLTNSLKYAFPEGDKGIITLSLKEIDNKQLQLVVADNGIGKPQNTAPRGTGFGTQLVELLTSQLQGTAKSDYQHGTQWSFYLEKANLN